MSGGADRWLAPPLLCLLLCSPAVFRAPEGAALSDLAAWCARGRRPAREIATREPSARSDRSDARPGLAVARGPRLGCVVVFRRSGCVFWIGTTLLDSLFSYPERNNLSSLSFPIQIVRIYSPSHASRLRYNLQVTLSGLVRVLACS